MAIKFLDAELVKTAVRREQYPDINLPEIALVGRSNVGKSSLINCLTNRKKLARTSNKPGKTATINFYGIDHVLRLVDLPGYGYAKVSKSEKEKWARMIETYLSKRDNLIHVFQLVDARHKPSEDDFMMMEWVKAFGYEPIVIATKLDKLKKSQVEENLTLIYESLELNDDATLIPFSSEDKTGCEDVKELIRELYEEHIGSDSHETGTLSIPK